MELTKNKAYERKVVSRIRGMAICLVIMAHCTTIPKDASLFAIKTSTFLHSISMFGVWLFFFLGGYLYAYNQKTLGVLLKRKTRTLFVPWFLTGLLIYVYTSLRHGTLGIVALLQYLIGYGSYLWYLTVFTFLLVFFYVFRRKQTYIAFIVFICMLFEIIGVHYSLAETNYNVYYFICLSWPVAFGIGYLINRWMLQEGILAHVRKHGLFETVCFMMGSVVVYFVNGEWSYWSRCYLPLCICLMPCVFYLATRMKKKPAVIFEKLGEMSFSIYLLHMPVAGIITNIFNRFDGGYLILVRVFLTMVLTYLCVRLFLYIGKILNREEFMKILIGSR